MRDLNPGDTHDVPPFSLEGGGCGCDFSPDSKELAFTENPDPVPAISTSAQIYTLDLTDPAAKPVKVSTSAGGNFNPGVFAGWKVSGVAQPGAEGYESDKFRLVVYDRAAKTIKDVLPKFDKWVDEFAWAPDSTTIYVASGNDGEAPVFRVALSSDETAVPETGRGEFSDLHPLLDNTSVIAVKMTIDWPAEVVELSTTRHTDRGQITHFNDALLAQLDLPKMESFWFTAKDGTKLQGFIIRPPGFDATKKYPVKFLIHGGPQGAWGDDLELSVERGTVCRERIRGGDDQSAWVDGIRAGDCGGREWRLGRQAFHRPDDGTGLRGAALSASSTRTASARWARATADTWPTGSSDTRTASSAS